MSSKIIYVPSHKQARDLTDEDLKMIIQIANEEKRKRLFQGQKIYPIVLKYGDTQIIETPDNIVIVSRFDQLVFRVKRALEIISRLAQGQFDKLEVSEGIQVEYVTKIEFDDYGFPRLVIEVTGIREKGKGYMVLDKHLLKEEGFDVILGEEIPIDERGIQKLKLFENF